MISCPDAVASIRGVNSDPGSLPDEGKTVQKHLGQIRSGSGSEHRPDVGVGVVVQQKLDHLLVAGAGAVKQSRPASGVPQLQLRPLLQEETANHHTLDRYNQNHPQTLDRFFTVNQNHRKDALLKTPTALRYRKRKERK